jgi:hypothetical protein
MAGLDERAAIKGGVDGAETQDLGFGAAGGGSVYVRAALAQGRVAIIPQLSRGWGAGEEDFILAVHPVEGAAQLAGHGGKLLGWKAAAFGQGFAAAHAGPETAVGKAVVRFSSAEVLGQLALGDMTHDADVGRGLERMMDVVCGEIAAVPGAAHQRGELARLTAELVEHGGELFRKHEEAAVGDGLLITLSVEDAFDSGATYRDAMRGPAWVDFCEEAGDLAPAGSFAGLAGFADQDDEEIEAVAGGADAAVKRGADEIAEGGEELQQDGGGIGFNVRGKAADDEAGKSVEGGIGERRRRGRG